MTGLLPAVAAGISPLPGVVAPEAAVAGDGFALVFAAALPVPPPLGPAAAVAGGVTPDTEAEAPAAAAVPIATARAAPQDAGVRVRGAPIVLPTPEPAALARQAKDGSFPVWGVPRPSNRADGAMPARTAAFTQRALLPVEAGPVAPAPDRGPAGLAGAGGVKAGSRPEVAVLVQPGPWAVIGAPMPDNNRGGQPARAAGHPAAAARQDLAAAEPQDLVAAAPQDLVAAAPQDLVAAEPQGSIAAPPQGLATGIADAEKPLADAARALVQVVLPATRATPTEIARAGAAAAALPGSARPASDKQRDEDADPMAPQAVGVEPVPGGLPPVVLVDVGGLDRRELVDRRPALVVAISSDTRVLPVAVDMAGPADGRRDVAPSPPQPGLAPPAGPGPQRAAVPVEPGNASLPDAGASTVVLPAITRQDDGPSAGTVPIPRALPADVATPAQSLPGEAAPVPVVRKPAALAAATEPAPAPAAPPAGAGASVMEGRDFIVRADPGPNGSMRRAPEPDSAAVMTIASERLGDVGIGVDGGAQDLRVRLTASAVATGTMAAEMPRLIAELAASGVRVQSLDLSARPEAPGSAAAGSTAQGQSGGDAPQRQPPPAAVAAMVRDAGASDLVRGDGRRAPSSDRYA